MPIAYNRYLLAADAILLTHFAFVSFIVIGFVIIWMGYFFKLNFIRNGKFRICHISAMGIVLAESLVGMICPLTEWENTLRIRGGEGQVYSINFMKEWVHRIMFYDFSEQTFLIIYIVFFALVFLTFLVIPPKFKSRRKKIVKSLNC